MIQKRKLYHASCMVVSELAWFFSRHHHLSLRHTHQCSFCCSFLFCPSLHVHMRLVQLARLYRRKKITNYTARQVGKKGKQSSNSFYFSDVRNNDERCGGVVGGVGKMVIVVCQSFYNTLVA